MTRSPQALVVTVKEWNQLDADFDLRAYTESRQQLLERLEAGRQAIDDWIEAHRSPRPGLAERAFLEKLLIERRALFAELVELDEALLHQV